MFLHRSKDAIKKVIQMKPVETPWFKLSRFFGLCFGIPLILVGLFWNFGGDKSAFLINGLLWCFIALVLLCKGIWNAHRLKKLQEHGGCYQGTVVEVCPLKMVRIGGYVTARVACIYQAEQATHRVLSGICILSPWDRIENLFAEIYVDKNDRNRYTVVVCRKNTLER